MPALANPKHEAFARAFVVERNGAKAARTAGFTGKAVAVTASKLLKRPEIAARIAEVELEALAAAEANDVSPAPNVSANSVSQMEPGEAKALADRSAARVIEELRIVAFSDLTELFEMAEGVTLSMADLKSLPPEVRRCISKVKARSVTRSKKDGGTETETVIEVAAWDKNAALRMLGQHHALFKEVVETRSKTLEDALKELAAEERQRRAAGA